MKGTQFIDLACTGCGEDLQVQVEGELKPLKMDNFSLSQMYPVKEHITCFECGKGFSKNHIIKMMEKMFE